MDCVCDCITSFIDGRVRLRHPALKQREIADMAAASLGAVDGVTEVKVNPVTGSLQLFYDPEVLSREKLLKLAEQGTAVLPQVSSAKTKRSGDVLSCLLGRRATRMVDRAMLVSLLICLAGLAAGSGSLHRVAGAVFTAAGIQHLAAHRKALW